MKHILSFVLLFLINSYLYSQPVNNTGKIQIIAPVTDTLIVIVDNNYSHFYKVVSGEVITVEVGLRTLIIASSIYPDFELKKEVKAGEQIIAQITSAPAPIEVYFAKSSYPRYKTGANLFLNVEDKVELQINGVNVGKGSGHFLVPSGEVQITAISPVGRRLSKTVLASDHQLTALDLNVLPQKNKAMFLSLIPGASQLYKQQYVKAGTFAASTLTALILAANAEGRLNQAKSLRRFYIDALNDPNITLTPQERDAFSKGVDRQGQRIERADRDIYLFLGVALGSYAVNVLDGVIAKPKGGYANHTIKSREYIIGLTGAGVRFTF